jgi:hypothetical protein
MSQHVKKVDVGLVLDASVTVKVLVNGEEVPEAKVEKCEAPAEAGKHEAEGHE